MAQPFSPPPLIFLKNFPLSLAELEYCPNSFEALGLMFTPGAFLYSFFFSFVYSLFFLSLKLSGIPSSNNYLHLKSAHALFRNSSGLFLSFLVPEKIHNLTITCKNGYFLHFLLFFIAVKFWEPKNSGNNLFHFWTLNKRVNKIIQNMFI